MAETTATVRKRGRLAPILKGLRPAVPAMAGAFGLTFLFAAMMPMPWIASICWNFYLDLIHPIFAQPLGNAARAGVALLFASGAAIVALIAALALAKPAVKGNRAMNQRVAARARQTAGDADADVSAEPAADSQALRRRRIDGHPDAPPVSPISAMRDLPAGGLGPSPAPVHYGLSDDMGAGDADQDDADAPFDLGAAMQVDDCDPGSEPDGFAVPVAADDAGDTTLGGMVARFEAGLDRRRSRMANPPTAETPPHANEDDEPAVDLALEAALSTLQRMSRTAVG